MWRDTRWGMLQVVGIVRSQSAGEASLRTSRQSLLDMLFEELLLRAEGIIRRGLVKGYRYVEQNIGAVRGKIMLDTKWKRRSTTHLRTPT